jgi:hypothetical protein
MDDGLPESIWQGTFTVFGVELRCHVLCSGQRIIEADSMARLIEAMEAPGDKPVGDIEALYRWKDCEDDR